MPRYIKVRETASTNTYLERLAGTLPTGTVIYTPRQTAGRGQKGNSWESEPDMNLSFSMLLKNLPVKARDQFAISQVASLAVRDTLAAAGGEGFTVKWPNDVYWMDRKMCGILIESSLRGTDIEHCIIGIGVNINQQHFVSDAPNPVSLTQVTGETHDLDALLHQMCDLIEQGVQSLADPAARQALHERYRSALYRNDGLQHPYEDTTGQRFMASVQDVAPTGELTLLHEDGTAHTYLFKEVKHVIHANLTL